MKLPIILLSLFTSFFSVAVFSDTWPEEYAEIAVSQQKENLSLSCSFSTPRWHSNYDKHREWAKAVPVGVAKGEIDVRNTGIKVCKTAWSYAEKAVEQNILNEEYRCENSGPRWHSNKNHHFSWAIKSNEMKQALESQSRNWDIEKCKKQYRSKKRR